MPNDDEQFEQYLRAFRGPEAPPGLARRAVARAHRRRIAVHASVAVFLAAAASVPVVFLAVQPDKTQDLSGLQAATHAVNPNDETSPVDRGSLTLAYSIGGMDGLNDRLDSMNLRFTPVRDYSEKGLRKIGKDI